MRFFRARLAPALLLVLLLPVRPALARDAARELEKLERDLVAAIGRGDLATYDRIVADDYVAFEASGKTTPKVEILASYRSGARKYTNLEIFDVQGRVFGETAVVTAKTKGLRREEGRDVPNRVRYVRVYAKRDGKWRAVAQMAALLSEDVGSRRTPPAITGSWGGEHVGLVATDRGANFDFDCANGSIDRTIVLDDQGRFEVTGTYFRERPGPVGPGPAKGEPALYRGRINGNTMTLSVELAGSDVKIGTYTLERDRLPRIRKCG